MAVALIAALVVALGGQRTLAAADTVTDFIQVLGDEAVAILEDKDNKTFAEREAAFRDVMDRGFDIPTVARFVMGRHWKSATDEQRAELSAIFLDFIVRVYTSRFDTETYGGETFEVRSAIADESGDIIVRAHVVRPSGENPIKLDFRVRPKDGTYKVIDLHVAGISMLHTHRVEFGSVVKRKGIDGLLRELRAIVEAPVGEAAE